MSEPSMAELLLQCLPDAPFKTRLSAEITKLCAELTDARNAILLGGIEEGKLRVELEAAQACIAQLLEDARSDWLAKKLQEARDAALESALMCYSPDDCATDWADKIRAMKGGA